MDQEARLKSMTENLGLSADQQAKIKAIFEKNAPKFKELKDKGRDNLTDADKKAMSDLRKAQTEEINAVLTPEQQAKMKEARPGNNTKQAAQADAAKAAATQKQADAAKAATAQKQADAAKAAAAQKQADDAKAAAAQKQADDAKAAAAQKQADDANKAKDAEARAKSLAEQKTRADAECRTAADALRAAEKKVAAIAVERKRLAVERQMRETMALKKDEAEKRHKAFKTTAQDKAMLASMRNDIRELSRTVERLSQQVAAMQPKADAPMKCKQ